jgi:hypothetical protein
MATTTNYGWTTPDDTALVKDGAAAIRTLGSSVDTTTKALNPETTLGDIAYRSSTANVKTRLGIGSTGDVLTVSGGVPTWAAPASSGGMTLISETVASGLSSLSLSSIPGTYKQLVLMWYGIYHSGSSSAFSLRFNNNSTALAYETKTMNAQSTSSFYSGQGQEDNISFTSTSTFLFPFGQGVNNSSTFFPTMGSGIMTIDNYASTTKFKSYNITFGYYRAISPAGYSNAIGQGTWVNSSAITSIDIVRLSGSETFSNASNSTIRLYGVS